MFLDNPISACPFLRLFQNTLHSLSMQKTNIEFADKGNDNEKKREGEIEFREKFSLYDWRERKLVSKTIVKRSA